MKYAATQRFREKCGNFKRMKNIGNSLYLGYLWNDLYFTTNIFIRNQSFILLLSVYFYFIRYPKRERRSFVIYNIPDGTNSDVLKNIAQGIQRKRFPYFFQEIKTNNYNLKTIKNRGIYLGCFRI